MADDKLFEKLLHLFSQMYTLEIELTKNIGIAPYTQLQFKALQTIYLHEKSTTSSIATCLGLSLPNASREIQKLIGGGLVQKRQDVADKRVHWLDLTASGLDFVRRTLSEVQLSFERATESWPREQRLEFSTALDTIISNLPK